MQLDVLAFAQLKLAGSQGSMWVCVCVCVRVACLIEVCWAPKKHVFGMWMLVHIIEACWLPEKHVVGCGCLIKVRWVLMKHVRGCACRLPIWSLLVAKEKCNSSLLGAKEARG